MSTTLPQPPAYRPSLTLPQVPAVLTVALAGNPNSGKTTLFNALTGLRQKVANYPGVTVEKKIGRCALPNGQDVTIIDLPGTYSLISRSPDERVAMEVLRGLRHDTPRPDVVVVAVDASNLQRNLYLVSQLIELGRPMVIALTMTDLAERRGINVSATRLEELLGVPVVPVVGHKRVGLDTLKAAILAARQPKMPDWDLPPDLAVEVSLVGGGLAILDDQRTGSTRGADLLPYQRMAERLLIGDYASDVTRLGDQPAVRTLLAGALARLADRQIDPMQADIESHYRWIDRVAAAVSVGAAQTNGQTMPGQAGGQGNGVGIGIGTGPDRAAALPSPRALASERVDRILLHKVWGMAAFVGIMATIFISLFYLADPLMGAIEGGVGWLGDVTTGVMPEGALKDLIKDGIFGGVGGVVVFIPQIAILFLFLAVLEDSGYLARAAFLMDKLLSKVGLNGKSFIPLLSSFACAIPGIMAARTLENRRERLATIFVAPFMSCSARLPVYALLIGMFFSGYGAFVKGGVLLALYGLGVVAAAGTAWAFKLADRNRGASSFILELPAYRVPQVAAVVRQMWGNTWAFISKAGTIILALTIVMWALTYYPRMSEEQEALLAAQASTAFEAQAASPEQSASEQPTADQTASQQTAPQPMAPEQAAPEQAAPGQITAEQAVSSAQLRHSFAGRFGHLIEPVIQPLGYDWKMGVGLLSAFAAREVFVSTMGVIYSAGDAEEDTAPLGEAMRADVYADGRAVWTPAVGASLLVWFVLAMQCMSTVAIVRRETGGWKWPLLMIAYMNALAYVAALVVYQTCLLMGWGVA